VRQRCLQLWSPLRRRLTKTPFTWTRLATKTQARTRMTGECGEAANTDALQRAEEAGAR
jgi:hypothetical protein